MRNKVGSMIVPNGAMVQIVRNGSVVSEARVHTGDVLELYLDDGEKAVDCNHEGIGKPGCAVCDPRAQKLGEQASRAETV